MAGAPAARWARRRTGAYLGGGRSLRDVVEPAARRLYSVLPYRVTGVSITAPDSVVAGADATVSVRVNRATEQHVVRITVTQPNGQDADWFARNVVAPRGQATVVLPFAESDAAGKWTVKVRDVLTGIEATRVVAVTAK